MKIAIFWDVLAVKNQSQSHDQSGAHDQILVFVMTYGFAVVGRSIFREDRFVNSLKSVCARVYPATGIYK
jgi:hypothetical protein